jgi:hypothetical protein
MRGCEDSRAATVEETNRESGGSERCRSRSGCCCCCCCCCCCQCGEKSEQRWVQGNGGGQASRPTAGSCWGRMGSGCSGCSGQGRIPWMPLATALEEAMFEAIMIFVIVEIGEPCDVRRAPAEMPRPPPTSGRFRPPSGTELSVCRSVGRSGRLVVAPLLPSLVLLAQGVRLVVVQHGMNGRG